MTNRKPSTQFDELRQLILAEHSKVQKDKIVAWVGTSQQRFDELVKLFLANEPKVSQRAGWPMSDIAMAQPGMAKKHLKALIKNMRQPKRHQADKRSTLRFLQTITVPVDLQGDLMDICFAIVEDPKEAIAVKAFALTNLQHLSKHYPEILPEIKVVIESQAEQLSPALKVRIRPFFT